jgi:hypothetical protein
MSPKTVTPLIALVALIGSLRARLNPSVTSRKVLGGVALAFASWALPALAEAVVAVDCSNPKHTISSRVNSPGIVIVVRGTCTENVVITSDDVTITTDGVSPATISALDTSQPTIRLDGAHRIRIDGVTPGGLTISGGTYGILASRGSTLDLSNCTVAGNSQNGVVASYSSTLSVDSCTVGPNTGNGVGASNTASLAITNSTVTNNTAAGVFAVRSSFVRVGQDLAGTPIAKPVTVSGSGGNGIAISESSAGSVVGGVVENSGATQLFVGRGSSGQIGLGSNNLTGGVTIRNGASHGISVEGGNATIVFSTITSNASTGILISNAGSARIGLLNGVGSGATRVSSNGSVGIHVAIGASAFIGGTTIDGNGTDPGAGLGRFGIQVFQGSVTLAGNNVITNNANTGIFVAQGGRVLVGDGAFGLGTTNTISSNGNGGIFAFQGGIISARNATISDNTGAAVQAFEAGVVELFGSTAVTVPAVGSTPGAVVQFGSTLQLSQTASIISATGDGIQTSNLTAISIGNGNTVQGNGAGGVGVRCFSSPPLTASAVTLTGNLSNVTGATGTFVGCNVFQ